MASSTHLEADIIDPPDLTKKLLRDTKRIIGHGSFGTVYRCLCELNGEVAVKAIAFSSCLDRVEKEAFIRKARRELGIWRRLDHPNIVPFLGTACGEDFGSDHPCLVAEWMPHGTLTRYVKEGGTILSLPTRIRLIKGSVAGLEYLHSKHIVHGDFHPDNILIDSDQNARLTDFGFSQTVTREQDELTYLCTEAVRPGAIVWAAPELLYPNLYQNIKAEATLNSDIYSLGSIILFILSGKFPWNRAEIEGKLGEFKNPQRPVWPVIPDGVWEFIERCWSPRFPSSRPSAREVLSFSEGKLEQFLQPNPKSDINVVLFGPIGCGKSSIANLLAEEPVAQVSTDPTPCTRRPQNYPISIGERQFQLWDTMGFCFSQDGNTSSFAPFRLAQGEDIDPLLPYEEAHSLLRNLPNGVNLILLCAPKDESSATLKSLYWLIHDFFYGGRAPIAFVVTHFDTPDEGWWEHNQGTITQSTDIPARLIPRACVSTVEPGRDQSRQALKALLQTYAIPVTPIPPSLDLSSQQAASLNLTTHCGLSRRKSTALVKTFSRPPRPFNVVLFGQTGAGMSSIINLIFGYPVAKVSSGVRTCTSEAHSYAITIGTQQFVIWDTMGLGGVHSWEDTCGQALENAAQLIHHLSGIDGIDLLVFCKRSGVLTSVELVNFKFFESFLCEGRIPVAVVITHLEMEASMDAWWESNRAFLLRMIGPKKVIGHACVTSLPNEHAHALGLSERLQESRLSVLAMLERYASSRSTRAKMKGISVKSPLRLGTGDLETGSTENKLTVENLMGRCGLTKEQAEELIFSYGSA